LADLTRRASDKRRRAAAPASKSVHGGLAQTLGAPATKPIIDLKDTCKLSYCHTTLIDNFDQDSSCALGKPALLQLRALASVGERR
jgi:hypothetical protein